jgi:GNAT superfamily N-acetyltransferase
MRVAKQVNMTSDRVEPDADPGAVAELVALALHDLPPARWLVPDPRRRAEPLASHTRVWVEHAVDHGHVDTIATGAGLVAAAVWFRHDDPADPMPAPDDYDRRVRLACRTYAPRFHDLDAALDAHQPHATPHHRLAYLAVHPAHRGRGYGTSLLTVHHDRLDQSAGSGASGGAYGGTSAFLTVSTPRAVELCRRHGYIPFGDPHHLPHHGPPMWPMWRQAAPARPGTSVSSGCAAGVTTRVSDSVPSALRGTS